MPRPPVLFLPPIRYSLFAIRLTATLLPFALAAVSPAQSTALRSGNEFTRQLETSTGVGWSEVPLREALETLGHDQEIAIMLDRRVDPGRPLNLRVAPQPLESVLKAVARQMDLGVCLVDSVAYFGPPEVAKNLATVAAMRRREAERLPRDLAAAYAQPRAWQWEALTAPRTLLADVAREVGAEIVDLNKFPHDLWPAVQLPPLAAADRLTLVLAGFGMTYQFSTDGKQIQLVPFPETAAISQTYPGKGNAQENANRIARLYPEAQVTVDGDSIRVVGPWEAHHAIEALMQGRRVGRTMEAPKKTPGRTVYTLNLTNEPVGGVIKALAAQLSLTVEIDQAAEPLLPERISIDVTDVSRDELLRAILGPVGLKHRLEGDTLKVLKGE